MENIEIILQDIDNPVELEAWKDANPHKDILRIQLIGNTIYLEVV